MGRQERGKKERKKGNRRKKIEGRNVRKVKSKEGKAG